MKKCITIILLICLQITFAAVEVNRLHWNDIEHNTFNLPEDGKVIVTPNPTRNNTVIKILDENTQIIQISIYSLLGNQIFSKNYLQREKDIHLNVQPFKKGKYLIKITFQDGSTEVKALIKQ